jgi:probable HAF family extracellular repeat protein
MASGAPLRGFLWQNGAYIFLGTLGGAESTASDINNSGQIIGSSDNAMGHMNAFIWQHGVMTDLGVLPGDDDSYATAINSSGAVVGFSTLDGNNPHAFLWQDGVMTDLGQGAAEDINDSNQIVGYGAGVVGFLLQDGVETPLSFSPIAINNAGVVIGGSVVGGVGNIALVWKDGEIITNIAPVPGTMQDTAEAINDAGEIVGEAYTPTSYLGFLWQNGVTTALTDGHSDIYGQIHDINLSGQVVGLSSPGGRAFVWQDGELEFLGFGPISTANGINDLGQIVGAAPAPEPSAWLLLISGIGMYFMRRVRSRS